LGDNNDQSFSSDFSDETELHIPVQSLEEDHPDNIRSRPGVIYTPVLPTAPPETTKFKTTQMKNSNQTQPIIQRKILL
jgi:hypothetical protein